MKQNISNKLNKVKTDITQKKIKKKSINKSDLTMGMIRVIIVCLLLPYLSLSVVLFYFSDTKTKSRIEDTVTTSMGNAAELCKSSIESVIDESKNATYDGVIGKSYNEFVKTKCTNEPEMYNEVSEYLRTTYKYSPVISSVILLYNRRTAMEYYTYSNVAGATYASISYFKESAMPIVRNVAKTLGTGTKLVLSEGHLYLVRNMVTSDYTPFAILVMEINVDNVFKSLDNVVWMQDGLIYLNNELIRGNQNSSDEEEAALINYAETYVLNDDKLSQNEVVNVYDSDEAISYFTMNVNGQKITYVVKLDKVGILNENSTLIYTYVIVVILIIPLLYATFHYFYANISEPIDDLMLASEKIEDGNYGYKIKEFKKNKEFSKLVDTFNHMSVSLEESFNRIYAEEVALRDANMQALQSQINPHFLNNTLEIINWKARMSGNNDVSGMIESLGIMMEATMNRRNESFIAIREEMKYVDAYLYIIVQRFGSKFEFSKEIDEGLMDIKIPRLIIQPLVENMVEHSGDMYGNRKGMLKIWEDDEYIHIVVENNGNLTEKDAEKIEMLLNSVKLEENVHNIGIRNVNLRLKLLYGEGSGLAIVNKEDNLTVSEIVIEKSKL